MSTTKTTTAKVEYTLEDFDEEELITELKSWHLTKDEKDDLKEFLFGFIPFVDEEDSMHCIKADNLADAMKLELLEEAMQKFSIDELQKRLA